MSDTSKPGWLQNWQHVPNKWQKGQSGNPAGRKPGQRNKRTLVGQELDKQAEGVAQRVVKEALEGCMVAAKLVLDRVAPPLRPEAPKVEFELTADKPLAEQGQQVLIAVSLGQLDAHTGKLLIDCLSAVGGLREHDAFGERLAQLEREVRENKNAGVPGAVMQTGAPS